MNPETFESYLLQTWQLLKQSHPSKVLATNRPEKVRARLSTDFPSTGCSFQELLSAFETEVRPGLNQNTLPQFGAYITGSGNPVGALAEFVKGYFNQNGLKWNNSPIAAELEQLVVRWVAEYCHLPQHTRGLLTSGGSMSNFLGIHLALAARYPDREVRGLSNAPSFTVYCSDQTHSSIDRAMVFLGLGRHQLRKVPVNDRFEILVDKLEATIRQDQKSGHTPLMLIGNAGTTNTGSTDDLVALGELAKQYNLWYHVDGAYGLPAIRLPELASNFEGVQMADSVIVNPHKWMYVPFEASCILLKEIPQAIHFSPDYLFTENPGERWESSTHTIELSKEFRALKVWFTLKYYGADRLTAFVQKDIAQIDLLANLLGKIPHVQVEPHHPLSILCFRYEDPERSQEANERLNVDLLRRIEAEGHIFITGTRLHGRTYGRVYYGNPDRTDADAAYMADVIARTLEALR